jgi:light-regulated signal transduction histidine kinase (bacteriophytochrome)
MQQEIKTPTAPDASPTSGPPPAQTPETDVESRCRILEATVREQAAQLAALHRELENFSHSVSHDLKAPLRAIDGFARIIQEQHAAELGPDVRQLFQYIQRNAHRMAQLIQDLVTFNRIGSVPLIKAALNLEELARIVFDELQARAPGRTIRFEISPLPLAWADPKLMRLVLFHLLSNAIKFTRGRDLATIDLQGSASEREAVFQLRDNGAGFDSEYAEKLFGMFQRLHSPSEFEGNGAGLAIVQRIIHRHGGRIWAQSLLEGGTSIYFSLPLEHPST